MKTAVIGLGLLGAEIALRLQRQGLEVTCWNRGAARAEAARQRGLRVLPELVDALADVDLILVVLSDAAAIRATLFDGRARAQLDGRILVQMGTIAPAESRALAAQTESLGGAYLEAPVLGSLPEAREGTLILMAGGEPARFERCLPVLRNLSPAPRLIGPVGQAATLKLALNQLISGLTASFALSLGLVEREGIEVEQFMELLRGSALYAKTFDKKLDKYLSHDYANANFPLKHLLKDVRLVQAVAAEVGLATDLPQAVGQLAERALAQGLGDQDYAVLYEAVCPGAMARDA